MPGKGTERQTIRIPLDLWKHFGEVATENDADRSLLVRQFIAWYIRERGAKLPPRPTK